MWILSFFRQNLIRNKLFLQSLVALVICIATTIGQGRTTRSYNNKNKADPPARPNSYVEDTQVQPEFDNTTNKNVTTQLGKTAYLHCRVKNLGDKTVSWIRHLDLHILTVGRYTYTSDQRYQSLHFDGYEDWTLQIKYPQKRDAGIYECQVSTEPKISMFVNLNVVDFLEVSPPSPTRQPFRRPKSNQVAVSRIIGAPDLHIKTGSIINITCIITQSPHPPTFIFWYHNNKVINYDSERGVSIETQKSHITTSQLLMTNARASDSGVYSCKPSTADAANVTVHIINGEKPAAIQQGGQSYLNGNYVTILLTLLSLLFVTMVPVGR